MRSAAVAHEAKCNYRAEMTFQTKHLAPKNVRRALDRPGRPNTLDNIKLHEEQPVPLAGFCSCRQTEKYKMVTLSEVHASNARIASTLPAGLVAVFVGGTSGLGEYALLALAKHARSPRVYIIGRVQEAADRIIKEAQGFSPDGQFQFIKADVSLLASVDEVCRQIKSKEAAINLLFLTQGTLVFSKSKSLTPTFSLDKHKRTKTFLQQRPRAPTWVAP